LKPVLRAVVFDMDGVIVDSEHQWRLCETELFQRHVPTWSDADHNKIVGMGVEDLFHFLVREYEMKTSLKTFLKECHELAAQVYGKRVACNADFRTTVDALRARKMKVGLASSSPRAWIDLVLERFDLKGRFDAVASADDVAKGKTKPEPDLYLLACRRLGVEPQDAAAIEDSFVGATAAKRAGLICVGFRNGNNDEQDLSMADFELRSLADASYEKLTARLKAA
jgi:HAD superfamily hydrolase (TIGR01509 family)